MAVISGEAEAAAEEERKRYIAQGGDPSKRSVSVESPGKQIGDFFLGSGSKPGLFGGGQYEPTMYDPNRNAFKDPYSAESRGNLRDRLGAVDARVGPQMIGATVGPGGYVNAANAGYGATYGGATINQGAANDIRSRMMGLSGRLEDQSKGIGPSLAGEQLKAGYDQLINAQMAMAGSQKGYVNPALAMKANAAGTAMAGQQLNQQAALARMQEQMNAQNQLSGLYSGLRAQDLGVAGQQAALDQQTGLANAASLNQFGLANAGFQQQANMANQQGAFQQAQLDQQSAMANLQAQLEAQRQKDALAQFYTSSGMSQNEADRAAAMYYEKLKADQISAYNQAKQQAYESARGGGLGTILGMAGMAGAIGGLSDERAKTDVKSAEAGLRHMLVSSPGEAKTDITSGDSSLKNILGRANMSGPERFSAFPEMPTYSMPPSTPEGQLSEALATKVTSLKAMDQVRPGAVPAEAEVAPILARNAEIPKPKESASDKYLEMLVASSDIANRGQGGSGGKGMSMGEATGSALNIAKIVSMFKGSDKESKEAVKPGDGDLSDFLNKTGVHEYRYKNPEAPGADYGRFVSPMAQELEQSKIGQTMVVDTPHGKMVDYARGLGAMLSAEAMNHKRLNKIEKKVFG